ncbi:hypothetical protein RJZ56_001092 [Blastomyces dermatitidis]|uniref:Uncharacterized protein n=3 Tax=Blastomyces TaxID=229219 RepID=A0A179UZV9_BLAGS|nr:uncharacterized protein BDBG_08582 [Blastomyces gilchristii SLH14081]XP_045281841.1 uncharacterized protein BDCG_17393 [Blastomyces dermatitidis ER-3]EGE83002.2 hypothetical protein BDDG_05946 [Blastomyces dermatitidis ATCC 18188]EQL31846.1 hypothetical protein BDFG_05894 [Blastomyces dermatitidis ATCC 26199]OAT02114.1 hypothetical protein BDCG_17393 [Blastomyces dermatitidis ER-3]OAT13363.1 hypothetical protein BDBG_08582 [Blastomyces gilchristii SLH14081]
METLKSLQETILIDLRDVGAVASLSLRLAICADFVTVADYASGGGHTSLATLATLKKSCCIFVGKARLDGNVSG